MFSNEPGLSSEEVRRRQLQYGPNVLPEKLPPSAISIFVEQLKSPFVYILLAATLITTLLGHFSDAVIIFLAVLINTLLGFIQESRAGSALQSLKQYITTKTTAIREGKRVVIHVSEIVPGDLIVLDQGAKVPADGKLLFANRLYLNESMITGESMPVDKTSDSSAFMGTIVSSGQGILLVENTGKNTKMGGIALQIQEKEDDTPLQRQLKRFSKQLVIVTGSLTLIVFILGIIYRLSLIEIFTTSVALAVSSLPEGLLISLTVILAIGMQKIIKHRGLVRKLAAAETLGGVTIICVDKTGTLTQGKMSVTDCIGDKKQIAQQITLGNDLDDPLVTSAFEWGIPVVGDLLLKYPRLDSIPFSSQEKFFVSLHRWSKTGNNLLVNGAPELVLSWSDLSENERKEITSTIDSLTKQGKRIIGLAQKEVSLDKTKIKPTDAKGGLTWIGLLAFSDPVRLGVKEALEVAKKAGIKITVITGDYAQTAEYVLSELNMPVKEDEILTGDELGQLSTEELSRKVASVRLFARTSPDQKLMIVNALKQNGEVVAMMGDGVNDAPALHKADIGIVVEEASDVAKQSADLVLLDSNFSTIIEAIEEGRGMFENIRKIILYLMSDAFAEIILVVGGIILGLPLPITAIQILWINIVSDGFPSMALTVDPKRKDIMRDRPQSFGEKLVMPWMVTLIIIVSSLAGLAAFLAFFVAYQSSGDISLARSAAFITLGFDSLVYVFSVRSLMTPFWENHLFENRWLILAVLFGLILQILPFTTASLRHFFGLENLDLLYWLMAFGSSILIFFVIETFKFIYNRMKYGS